LGSDRRDDRVSDDSVPRIEIEADDGPTAANQLDPPAHSRTMPHNSVDWMAGFDEGRQRGAVEMLEALEASLVAVGVDVEVAKVIVARVRARAEELHR
jgi:hypothetical protein